MENNQPLQNQPANPGSIPPTAPVIEPSSRTRKSNIFVKVLLLVLLVAVVGAGIWYWQQQKVRSANSQVVELENQNKSLAEKVQIAEEKAKTAEEEAAKEAEKPNDMATTAQANDPLSLLPAVREVNNENILLEGLYIYKDGMTEIWIEYGESSSSLTKLTAKATREIALGPDDEQHSAYGFTLASSDLKTGTRYYFRIAATYKGQTYRSSIASFVTKK